MLSPQGSENIRRRLLATGSSKFDEGFQELEDVPEELEMVRAAFTSLGYIDEADESLRLNPDHNGLLKIIDDARDHENSGDVLAVYYTGHGDRDPKENRYYLITRNSSVDKLHRTAVSAEDLARNLVIGSKASQILIILDLCHSAAGGIEISDVVNELTRSAIGPGPCVRVIAASRIKQTAQQGALVRALTQALANDYEQYGGKTQRHLLFEPIMQLVKKILADLSPSQQINMNILNFDGAECLLFPNPKFRFDPPIKSGLDLESQAAFDEHWIPKARSAEMGVAGWYFTGREQALRELVAWFNMPRSDGKARLVTGSAGSGKSALLARLVTLSDPQWRQEVLDTSSSDLPEGTVPPAELVNAAVVLRRKLLVDVVAELARQLHIKATEATALREAVRASGKKMVLVIDALDEADERQKIIDDMLRPLAALPNVFLLVGTRPDPGAFGVNQGRRVDAFGAASEELDLDDPSYGDPADVVTYVKRRLLATEEPGRLTPYQASPDRADLVARAIAERASHSFLVARTAATALLARPDAVDVGLPGWEEELPRGFEEALEQFLEQLDHLEVPAFNGEIARAALLPLAFAEGEGLPWEQIWAGLASAISSIPINDEQIRLLRQHAAPFIVEALENGGSVYRLFHERAAEYLRSSVDVAKAQTAIVSALRDLVPVLPAGERLEWTSALPYIRTHLATHAGKAGCIGDLTQDLGFLTASDPKRLLTALEGAKEEGLETITAVVRLALPHLLVPDQGSNAAYLTFAAMKLQVRDLAEALKTRRGSARWWPRAMQWTPSSSHLMLKTCSCVRALALGSHRGQLFLASGGDDGNVQLWNLENLELKRTLDAGDWVDALAFHGSTLTAGLQNSLGIFDRIENIFDREERVSGNNSSRFIRWDLGDPSQPETYTGDVEVKAIGSFGIQPVAIVKSFPPDHDLTQSGALDIVSIPNLQQISEKWSSAVSWHRSFYDRFALGMAGDEPCLAYAHDKNLFLYKGDGSRLVLDLSSVQALEPKEDIVNCLAVGTYGRQPAVAAGSNSGVVRVWDVESLLLLAVFQDDDNYIDAVAIGELHGRPVAISGTRSNTIRILYPIARGHESNFAHQGTVWCIALFDGLLASWGRDQTLRLWDADTMQPVAKPLRMASGEGSVAYCRLNDQTTLITGSDDGVARWDWRQGMRITERPKTPVFCMTVAFRAGKMVILTGNDAGLIEVLDATSLRPVCTSLQATTESSMGVQTLKVVSIAKRSQVLSAGSAKLIERWDLETLRPIGSPLKGHDSVIYEMASFTMGDAVMLASCSADRTVRLWDLQSGLQHGSPLSGHQSSVGALAAGSWKGETALVSGDRAGDLKVWNPATSELMLELSLDSWIYSLVMGEDKVFVGCGHGVLQIELT